MPTKGKDLSFVKMRRGVGAWGGTAITGGQIHRHSQREGVGEVKLHEYKE